MKSITRSCKHLLLAGDNILYFYLTFAAFVILHSHFLLKQKKKKQFSSFYFFYYFVFSLFLTDSPQLQLNAIFFLKCECCADTQSTLEWIVQQLNLLLSCCQQKGRLQKYVWKPNFFSFLKLWELDSRPGLNRKAVNCS